MYIVIYLQPTIVFAPGSVTAAAIVSHASDTADRVGRPTVLTLAAVLLLLPAEAALACR